MEHQFEVITNVAEIAKLNGRLRRYLKSHLPIKRRREIAYPVGHITGTVYFESLTDSTELAWSPIDDTEKLANMVMFGNPSSQSWLQIHIQLNFPARTYDRRMAGAFVKDSNGDIFVAHRGRLTKGHGALKKDKVFEEFAAQTIDARDRERSSRLILIGELDDIDLVDRLREFAFEARRVAKKLGAERDGDSDDEPVPDSGTEDSPARKVRADSMLKLREYFGEYAGTGERKGHGNGKRTVEHGAIVHALYVQLRSTGARQKAQAIDLAIVSNVVDLYEVKTSSRTTDMYTGVGQLLIHGESISKLLKQTVRRHLVLPTLPNERYRQPITKKANINIVTFSRRGKGYAFEGLL